PRRAPGGAALPPPRRLPGARRFPGRRPSPPQTSFWTANREVPPMTSDPGSGPGTPEGAAAPSWWVYRGPGAPSPYAPPLRERLPPPPPWRRFPGAPDTAPPPEDPAETERVLGPPRPAAHRPLSPAETEVATAVNAALLLRRPLLVTGPPGVGKSSLAYRVAREDRKSTRLNSSHVKISYAVFCLKKKKKTHTHSNNPAH